MDVSLSQDLWDDELALIVAASADPVIVHETYLPRNMTSGQAKRWFFGQKRAYFVVFGDKPVGMVIFHPKPAKSGVVEVETWVVPEYQGLGISKRAHPLVVEEAKQYWDTMTAWVWATNSASLGLLRHTGFERTGKEYEQGGLKCVELSLKLTGD